MGSDARTSKVLHVDDKAGFADMVATFLEREDASFEVSTATNVRDGLDHLDDTAVDCIVADYDMPGQTGIEFLTEVRDEYPDLPFILFTGKGSEEVASDAISAGVTDYLQKSGESSQYTLLANRIKNAVQNYRNKLELRDRDRRLQLFFEESPLGIIEWNRDFEFVRTNEAARDILGYEEGELWGQSWEVHVPEDDRDTVCDRLQEILETKQGTHGLNRNIRKDGEQIVCEWHNQVVTNDAGEITALFSLFQDVTDRVRQEQRLERLVDSVPGIVYRCKNEPGWPMEDVRGDVEQLIGYTAEELESRTGLYGEEVIHPADRETVWSQVQTALDDEESFELEYRVRTDDGTVKQVWERGQGVYSVNGDLQALEGFITELTG